MIESSEAWTSSVCIWAYLHAKGYFSRRTKTGSGRRECWHLTFPVLEKPGIRCPVLGFEIGLFRRLKFRL
jgi:hypothetical protein